MSLDVSHGFVVLYHGTIGRSHVDILDGNASKVGLKASAGPLKALPIR